MQEYTTPVYYLQKPPLEEGSHLKTTQSSEENPAKVEGIQQIDQSREFSQKSNSRLGRYLSSNASKRNDKPTEHIQNLEPTVEI